VHPQEAVVDGQPSSLSAPPMGWYETGAGSLRWWDGSRWTSSRIGGGTPGADWAATEQPTVAWVLGGMFLTLGVTQFGLAMVVGALWVSGALMWLQALIFFAMAAQTTAVRRIPAPRSSPVAMDAVRPLPGEQEGPAAGWYPVAPRVSRWWTGARWSQYIGTQHGVRPTFTGARTLRIIRRMGWTILGVGTLGLIAGAAAFVIGVNADGNGLTAVIGGVILFGGVLFAGLGAFCFVLLGLHRRTLLPPQFPPPSASAQGLGAA
jgi:hypothetical protein